ncbi:MAG: hypothetical protein AABN95_15945 [Acidobacteriota bacterium]
MKKLVVSMLMSIVLVAMVISFALARGAPNENAFTDQATVSVDVSPTLASVPPMTVGYDVIQNISTPAAPHVANVQLAASDISAQVRQSTTGDKRNLQSAA